MIDALLAQHAAGATHLTMRVSWPGMPQADVLAGIELLGRQVLPEVRRRTAARRAAEKERRNARGGGKIEEQLVAVLGAWGMSAEHAAVTAQMMVETDLRGVDSHGISMLPTYDKEFRAGRLNMRPQWKVVRDRPSMARIDADRSLGHPISAHAMNLAVDKCRATGVGVVAVFNSHHFGAAGCYAKIAADRGVIGMVTSATRGVTLVPTFAAEPIMGTNPLAFAAPARRNAPFQLDMATTTVAAGKVKVYKLNHKPVPSGWVVDGDGRAVTDETEAFRHVFERPEGCYFNSLQYLQYIGNRSHFLIGIFI